MEKKEKLDSNKLRHAQRLAQAAKDAGIEVEIYASVVRPIVNKN